MTKKRANSFFFKEPSFSANIHFARNNLVSNDRWCVKDAANIEITIGILRKRNIYGRRKRDIRHGNVREIYKKMGHDFVTP